ncbi:SCO family protein, partial [Pseudomonas syringae pv. tagetis]
YIGLTPPGADIQILANSVSIPFKPADTCKVIYFVDHSGNLALFGPDCSQRGFIRGPLNNLKLV